MTSPDDLPDWDLEEQLRSPAAIVAVPAGVHRDPRGKRVIVGVPGLGWRTDLRGDSTVVQGSRTYVPVLAELEWYRAEVERTEVFAPLVPIERVWVETPADQAPQPAPQPPPRQDLVSRLVSLDTPPPRHPVPARDAATLTGRRLVRIAGPDDKAAADRRDLRAVTEAYTSADGDICVRLVTELDWYRWAWTGKMPKTMVAPIHLLWLE